MRQVLHPKKIHNVLLPLFFLQIAVAAAGADTSDADETMEYLIEQDVINAMSSSDGEDDGGNDDDDIHNIPFRNDAPDDDHMPSWCDYSGTDAFKIVLFLSLILLPLSFFALAYSFRLWRARVDVVRMYLEGGMSVRGTVIDRKSKTRTDYDGRMYHSQEIVVEYDPIFAASLVEENGEDNEDDGGADDDDKALMMANLRGGYGGPEDNCGRVVYRKRLRVSRDTFRAAAFGSIRLLVLNDSRSAFPAREVASLQRNSGVCWVWCFGLLVLASLLEVALNASCAGLWYCWVASITIALLFAYATVQCTGGVYHKFVDSIIVGEAQRREKDDVLISKQSAGDFPGRLLKFTRLTRVQSEPVGGTTSANEVKCARSKSDHFVVACPLVKI